MKLNELGEVRQTKIISNIFENYLGEKPLDLDSLSVNKAKKMLAKISNLVSEQKNSKSVHTSEKNPAYLKLIMLEQALSAHIAEASVGAVSSMTNNASSPGAAPAVDLNDPKTKMAMQKAERGQNLTPDEQKTMTAIALMKKEAKKQKRMVKEADEVQQAQVVLAAQDMVDQIQKMMEQVSEMQYKDLPALTDSVRNDIGTEQAEKFQSGATSALSDLLTSLQSSKTAMENSKAVLTGQEMIVPGEDDVNLDMDADADADADGEEQLDIDLDAVDVNADMDDDSMDDDESETLGRERREK